MERSPDGADSVAVAAARQLNRAAGVLATSVLADSSISHYRGAFHNKAMVTPIVTALASLAVSVHGHGDKRAASHKVRDIVYTGAALTGAVGTGFHLYNIAKRPGGVSPQNLFYAAPIGAPAALILSGLMGFLAERLRNARPEHDPTLLGIPAGRVAAAASGVGLLGTAGEAGLLHLRGAYHDPFMFLPVSVPPLAAAMMGAAAVEGSRRRRPVATLLLRLTVGLGLAGVGFHTLGVARNMDGWRNWRQNLLNGPPIPAPPSFTGLAMAALAALSLLGERRRG